MSNTKSHLKLKQNLAAAAAGILLGSALFGVPAAAFATSAAANTPIAGADQDVQVDDNAWEDMEDMCGTCWETPDASQLTGLSDAERSELQELYDKMYDCTNDEELTDDEYDRVFELEEKAHLALMKEKLSADEYAEFEKLYEKEAALEAKINELYENEGLTDEEAERMWTLEEQVYDSVYGHDEGEGTSEPRDIKGDDQTPQANPTAQLTDSAASDAYTVS